MSVEQDMDDASSGTDNQGMAQAARLRTLNRWLTLDDEVPRGVYRDPMG